MGYTAYGQICYGVLVEEGTVFPWDDDKYGGDIDDWWRDVGGYKQEEIYKDEGGLKPGISKAEVDAYWKYWADFSKKKPALVNTSVLDSPIYVLAVPSSIHTAEWSEPLPFEPNKLYVSPAAEKKLISFCDKFGIKHSKPKWFLSAYWG